MSRNGPRCHAYPVSMARSMSAGLPVTSGTRCAAYASVEESTAQAKAACASEPSRKARRSSPLPGFFGRESGRFGGSVRRGHEVEYELRASASRLLEPVEAAVPFPPGAAGCDHRLEEFGRRIDCNQRIA